MVSDNDKYAKNISVKLFPFDTFQFSKGFISDNNEQAPNIPEKSLQFDIFQFCK